MGSPRHDIAIAKTDAAIRRCSVVMRELRPHLSDAAFLKQVKRQMGQGYRLAFLEAEQQIQPAGADAKRNPNKFSAELRSTASKVICAVAGYRILESLAWGKFLYVDDLVTREADRSAGYGGALLDWLVAEAARQDCRELHLDSGVQRFGAHRFYLSKRMNITCHHFALRLTG